MQARLYSYLRLRAGTQVISLPLAQPSPVGEVITSIARLYPALAGLILTNKGQVAAHLVVTINGHPWRRTEDPSVHVRDEDRLDLFLAIGGGAAPRS